MKKFLRSVWPVRELKLRYKVGIVFFMPVLLALLVMLGIHFIRDLREMQANRSQVEAMTSNLGRAMLNGLRHAMLENDSATLDSMVKDMGDTPPIERIRMVGWNNIIWKSSSPDGAGQTVNPTEMGCSKCHQFPPLERPQAISLSPSSSTLRIVIPINQDPECRRCHANAGFHLGMMIVDSSVAPLQSRLSFEMTLEVIFSVIVLAACLWLDFALVQWLIVRRVEVIHDALLKFGGGDLSARVSQRWRSGDELTQLADQFDEIAGNFEAMQEKREEKERVRVQAIIEERERIARELHDGVAQFLGYLSAKVAAIRMALKNDQANVADKSLAQIEETVRDQSAEVRSAIIGLKMSGGIDRGLLSSIRAFVDQCNRIDDLSLKLETVGEVDAIPLSNETALQLFRILQEAVSNIRKHSQASEASIRFERQADRFIMTIRDNGVGFDPLMTGLERRGHFGLHIMVERAHAIGAQIEIKSSPGQGAQVTVALGIQEA